MTADSVANKVLVTRFIDEVFQGVQPNSVDELVSDDFTSHSFPSPSGDCKADLRAATDRMGKTLADIRFDVHELIAEGDFVVARLTAGARPIAEFMGIPVSGRSYEIGEIHIFRIDGGKIAEHWHEFDSTKLLSQLRDDEVSGQAGSPSA